MALALIESVSTKQGVLANSQKQQYKKQAKQLAVRFEEMTQCESNISLMQKMQAKINYLYNTLSNSQIVALPIEIKPEDIFTPEEQIDELLQKIASNSEVNSLDLIYIQNFILRINTAELSQVYTEKKQSIFEIIENFNMLIIEVQNHLRTMEDLKSGKAKADLLHATFDVRLTLTHANIEAERADRGL